jgi:hypothetical protein
MRRSACVLVTVVTTACGPEASAPGRSGPTGSPAASPGAEAYGTSAAAESAPASRAAEPAPARKYVGATLIVASVVGGLGVEGVKVWRIREP